MFKNKTNNLQKVLFLSNTRKVEKNKVKQNTEQ